MADINLIRPDQIQQDADNRMVTDDQITIWSSGAAGTVLKRIAPHILIERLAYSTRPDDTWAHDTWQPFNYPVTIPTYATSLILSCWLEVQTNDTAKMLVRNTLNLPESTALWAYGEGTVGGYIEIPYAANRTIEFLLTGDVTPGFLIEVVGYRYADIASIVPQTIFQTTTPTGIYPEGTIIIVHEA